MQIRQSLVLGAITTAIFGALSVPSGIISPADANEIPGRAATPIKHVVVIFQENVSFDHYFGTYPFAANTDGSPFKAANGTPKVNGLGTLTNGEPDGSLLMNNPNATNPANGSDAINPFRLSHSQASTCDQDHNYGDEQLAYDQGLMDSFPLSVGVGSSSFCDSAFSYGTGNGLVLGYFDGNTVTALWNYAQNFAMSDNSFGTTFGPSTPGLLNLVAGNTFPAVASASTPKIVNINSNAQGTIVGDLDPVGDACSTGITVQMGGKNIGDLLSENGISWGSFMGGFDLTVKNPDGTTGCARQSPATPANNGPTADYIPHHAFFQYWASTANPNHTRPTVPPSLYGTNSDKANHEYDIHDFFDALHADNLPSVSFLKAPANMDGHAGYSDPLLEQQFIVNTVNELEQSRFWNSTAVIIAYDDSDGWYDHQMSNIINSSAVLNAASPRNSDNLNGPGKCGNGTPLKDDQGNVIQGRCGYGPRLPLMVISPYAKRNFIDHTVTDQSSILRFIEDNWNTGGIGGGSCDDLAGGLNNLFDCARHDGRKLFLDPATGSVIGQNQHASK